MNNIYIEYIYTHILPLVNQKINGEQEHGVGLLHVVVVI
jgi:hypothetical protein